MVVDNVFATPILQKPLQLGADVVVYSATKHIDGQGRVLGGAVLGAPALIEEAYRDLDPPHRPGAVAVQRLGAAERAETLDLRVRRQSADRRGAGRPDRRAPQGEGRAAIPAAPTIRSTRSPGGR